MGRQRTKCAIFRRVKRKFFICNIVVNNEWKDLSASCISLKYLKADTSVQNYPPQLTSSKRMPGCPWRRKWPPITHDSAKIVTDNVTAAGITFCKDPFYGYYISCRFFKQFILIYRMPEQQKIWEILTQRPNSMIFKFSVGRMDERKYLSTKVIITLMSVWRWCKNRDF